MTQINCGTWKKDIRKRRSGMKFLKEHNDHARTVPRAAPFSMRAWTTGMMPAALEYMGMPICPGEISAQMPKPAG